MRYLKFLNLIPLCIFFLMHFITGTVIHGAPLIMVFVFGIMNAFISKNMKEYIIFSLMLLFSSTMGMILFTYYFYYFIDAIDEAPIFGAAVTFFYGIVAFLGIAMGVVIKIFQNRSEHDVEDKEDL